MKRMVGLTLVACGILAGGCQKDVSDSGEAAERDTRTETPYEKEFVTADTAEGYSSGQPAPVTPVQGGNAVAGVIDGPLTATGNLQGTSPDAPAGSVVVTQAGPGGTQVRIKIDRYGSGTQLQAALAAGTCKEPGRVITAIGKPFTVERSGFGTLIASIPQRTSAILDGKHSVRLTAPGTAGQSTDAVLACAELPGAGR